MTPTRESVEALAGKMSVAEQARTLHKSPACIYWFRWWIWTYWSDRS